MLLKIFQRYAFTLLLSICSLAVIVMAVIYFLIATPIGGRMLVHYLLLQSAQSASITLDSFSGNLKDGLILKNVQIKNWPVLGRETTVAVQRLDVRLPVLDLNKIEITIFNARLDLPNCDPMLFRGHVADGQVNGDLEAKSIDVAIVLKSFLKTDLYKIVHGTVSSVKLDIYGDVMNPSVKGGFVADKVTYGDKVVHQVFAKVDVKLGYANEQWNMKGLVILDGGEVDVDRNTFDLELTKIIFKDNLIDPDVDIRCSIHKDIYDIDIQILGTIKYNKITARSDPYLPQDDIFILLGLGKWSPLSNPLINLQNDAESVGIKRKLGDNLNFGYGFEQSSKNFRGESNSMQFLQGQMSLSDALSVNVEKTISTTHERESINSRDPRKDNESRLYLKYRNAF